jgi:hypothetical protein
MDDRKCGAGGEPENRRSRLPGARPGRHVQELGALLGSQHRWCAHFLTLVALFEELRHLDHLVNVVPALDRHREHRLDVEALFRLKLVQRVIRQILIGNFSSHDAHFRR